VSARVFSYPIGIASFSPRLQGTSYLGSEALFGRNPERVVSSDSAEMTRPFEGCWSLSIATKVARASQPSAERQNPFRTRTNAARLWRSE
jgi:hypothetical protein